jgi:alanine dehydrogenase
MHIGVPKEIKDNEYRVGLIPASVHELVAHGHEVFVEHDAGRGIGVSDGDYEQAGAHIAPNGRELFGKVELIVKVKEPLAQERQQLKPGQVLFTYLHLAPDPEQTRDLVASGAVCIGYETVTSARGGLPLLAPMSQVAGRMSIQAGVYCLEETHGGKGILLGGVPGVEPGKVVILGGGMVGANAAAIALGMGAEVVVLDRSTEVLNALWQQFGSRLKTVFSSPHTIEHHLRAADLVIGAVLIPGAAAPKLVPSELVATMEPGSVIVDVSIDQGGCIETSRPTTHTAPTYRVNDIVHYCVANMPGGVPRTSTFALNNATLPHVLALAEKGYQGALRDDPHLRNGLNICKGQVTCKGVAEAHGYPFKDPLRALL